MCLQATGGLPFLLKGCVRGNGVESVEVNRRAPNQLPGEEADRHVGYSSVILNCPIFPFCLKAEAAKSKSSFVSASGTDNNSIYTSHPPG